MTDAEHETLVGRIDALQVALTAILNNMPHSMRQVVNAKLHAAADKAVGKSEAYSEGMDGTVLDLMIDTM